MALRDILQDGSPILRKKCRPVKEVDDYVRRLLDDMLETMHHANGMGLAAPQVGVLRRVCIVEYEDTLYEFINPEIIGREGEDIDIEGCLSIPGRAGRVKRPQKVVVRTLDRNGETQEYVGEDYLAHAFCHEIDHLDGVLYTDIMIEEVDPDAELEEDDEE